VHYGDLPTVDTRAQPLADILAGLLQRLATLGFPAVYRHAFAVELAGLHVVKVVVPRCECADGRNRRIGPRLYQQIVGTA
jgi:ribosomal protein S12 methylthiotransferase accessory factor YcaO